MIYKFFDKKTAGSDIKSMSNQRPSDLATQQPANETHKQIIEKFKRRRVYSSFKDNIWGADLADMQLISKFNKGTRFLLCVIDLFSIYAWVGGHPFMTSTKITNFLTPTRPHPQIKAVDFTIDQ